MTTTNQAFIKAYRQDGAQPAPASPAITGAAPQEAARAPATVDAATAATQPRSALYGPRPARGATPHADATRESPPAATPKQPLSAFIAQQHVAAPETESAEILRPGTTIASFQWPPVCRALAQQCGRQLDRVADLLAREAQAKRTLIGVLGLATGRGTSTIALCLAARLAARDLHPILVDANFRSPRLASWLDAAPTTGWQDVLKHRGTLADAVIRAKDDRFDLLALDPNAPANALKLIGGLQAVVTAGVLRHSYDVALFDLGAFADPDSQPIVLELVRNMGLDAVLAITGPGPADARDLELLATQVGRNGCELLGTIENRVAKPQAA
jgi:Mrp family chromosome partitioning ATPase